LHEGNSSGFSREILEVMKQSFYSCEIKTDLHVEITKNCKALTGQLKKESSFGSIHPPSHELFSLAYVILQLVLLSVLTITDLLVCFFVICFYKWDVKFIHLVLQSTETNEGYASTFTRGNLHVLLHYSAMAH
jgi:hypothetical protein